MEMEEELGGDVERPPEGVTAGHGRWPSGGAPMALVTGGGKRKYERERLERTGVN